MSLSSTLAALALLVAGVGPGAQAPGAPPALTSIADRVGATEDVSFVVSHGSSRTPLPAGESDVIVVGVVGSSTAALDETGDRVVSRFNIHVEAVLKNTTACRIAPEDAIDVWREGGAVRLPSGQLLRYDVEETELPVAGGRYALLLESDEDGALGILRPFELRDGSVVALDGPPRSALPESLPTDEPGFLHALRDAIVSSTK